MEGKQYQLATAFDGLVTDGAVFCYSLLHDESSPQALELAEQFNDLYHLFLNKFARLTQESSVSDNLEEEMTALLKQLLKIKKVLVKSET